VEELVKFKKSIGERMLQSPDHKVNDFVIKKKMKPWILLDHSCWSLSLVSVA